MAALAGTAEAQANAALAHYRAQDLVAACAAIGEAAKAAPGDPRIAFMAAQFAYEGWYPAVALFEHAARLNPGHADLVRNFALALSAEGQGERAEALLEALLARNPMWIEGHNTLATLRVTAGEEDFCRSFAKATEGGQNDTELRLAWFHKLAAASQWDAARRVLSEAADSGAVRLARLYLDCEAGEASGDPAIFAPFANSRDPGVALMQVRHALRHGDPERALALAEAQLGQPHAAQFWPYCSLCWRLLGDRRAEWLAGTPPFPAAIDLDLSAQELATLATFLRGLHTMAAPYPEQSVKGGTQTGRNLLLHHDKVIQRLRSVITDAVASWRDGLPQGDAAHPFLGNTPADIRFSGSWSVRLHGGGHHSAHTHPRGWASSALYITVPESMGPEHAGALAIGMPPPELGLALAPERHFTPKPGRLVLFPSITWHGTVPFAGEERMTVAFDIAPRDAAH